MTIKIIDHDQCNGTGTIPSENAGQQRLCTACGGYGRMRVDGETYKKAPAHNQGRQCYMCDGKGHLVIPDAYPCYGGCSNGKIVAEAHVGDVLPDGIGRTASIPRPVMAALAAELTIVVGAANRGGTWNEAHLGLGTLWSTTDYGRTWDRLVKAAQEDIGTDPRVHLPAVIDAFREEIRADLTRESTQWVKLLEDDRTITGTVAVQVHRDGYTVISRPSIESGNRAVLPPTYTAELLNKEIR